MSAIPSFSYDLLWEERVVRSVANLTRRDGDEFLALAPQIPIRTTTTPVPLAEANAALTRLREGKLEGALRVGSVSASVLLADGSQRPLTARLRHLQ